MGDDNLAGGFASVLRSEARPCRLCAIWGIADLGERAAEVFDPALPYKGWLWLRQRCGLELGEYSQKISKDQGSAIEDVRFKKWTRFIQDSHRRGETWLPVTPQPLGRLAEAAHLGVERGDGRFCIPMRIGPILSYACVYRDRVRPATADTASADERLKRLIGHACGLWFNLSFLNINTWTAMFEPQTRSSALQIWAGSVQWTALQSSPPIKAICDLADSLTIPIPSPMHGAWIKETEPTSE